MMLEQSGHHVYVACEHTPWSGLGEDASETLLGLLRCTLSLDATEGAHLCGPDGGDCAFEKIPLNVEAGLDTLELLFKLVLTRLRLLVIVHVIVVVILLFLVVLGAQAGEVFLDYSLELLLTLCIFVSQRVQRCKAAFVYGIELDAVLDDDFVRGAGRKSAFHAIGLLQCQQDRFRVRDKTLVQERLAFFSHVLIVLVVTPNRSVVPDIGVKAQSHCRLLEDKEYALPVFLATLFVLQDKLIRLLPADPFLPLLHLRAEFILTFTSINGRKLGQA